MSEPDSQAVDEGSTDEDVQGMITGFGGFDIDPYRLAGYTMYFTV